MTPRLSTSRTSDGADQASAGSQRLFILVAVAGLVASATVSAWLWSRADDQAEIALSERGQLLVENISAAMDKVVDHLTAVGGLYQASEEVTRSEFGRFVSNFGVAPGVSGVAHAQVVPFPELDQFVSHMRETIPGYGLFEFDGEGRPIPVEKRGHYIPVGWIESSLDGFDAIHGFDLASEPFLSEALEEAEATSDVSATSFVQLPFEDDADGLVVFWPITDTIGDVDGFSVALIDLSDFLEAHIPPALSNTVDWEVVDLTNGREVTPSRATSWAAELDVGGRQWGLTVEPAVDADAAPDRTSAVLVFLIGAAASLLASLELHQYRQKSATKKELARLHELAASKDRFLASVSHELRTPLTGVLGFAELLTHEADHLDEEEKRGMVKSIADDAEDLAGIIDDLLVAARSELDLVTVTSQPIKLAPLVAAIQESPGDDPSRHFAVVEDPDTDLEVLGDPARVRQILRNMVSNAYRYGGEQIRISMSVVAGHGHVRVADNGAGLPPEDWERMFEPYVRMHETATQPAALGIGLSVSRHLARLMGGDLTYQHEDGWSMFDLSLPCPGDDATAERSRRAVTSRT